MPCGCCQKLFKGQAVGLGQVGGMDVIPDAGPIGGGKIVTENLHPGAPARSGPQHQGDQVGFRPVVFTKFTVRIGHLAADQGAVAHRGAMAGAHVVQHHRPVARIGQPLADQAADIPGSAHHQDVRHTCVSFAAMGRAPRQAPPLASGRMAHRVRQSGVERATYVEPQRIVNRQGGSVLRGHPPPVTPGPDPGSICRGSGLP